MTNDEWIKLGATLAAIVAALKAVFEYSQSNKIKKIDLLNSLIGEFNGDGNILAKRLLDDFDVVSTKTNTLYHRGVFSEVLRACWGIMFGEGAGCVAA